MELKKVLFRTGSVAITVGLFCLMGDIPAWKGYASVLCGVILYYY